MMQAASNEAADKMERAFLQILLQSLNSNNKEVSVYVVLLHFMPGDVSDTRKTVNLQCLRTRRCVCPAVFFPSYSQPIQIFCLLIWFSCSFR